MKNKQIVITLIILISTLNQFSIKAQIVKRVEPPFWWTEMKNPNLQIMVYGNNIADYDVRIKQKEFSYSIEKVENPNYIFLNLTIPDNLKSASLNIELSKNRKIVETINYELQERKYSKNKHQGFDNSDVIYLLMPDRFSNGDLSNDSNNEMFEKANRENPNGRHGGDIQGIINHLDYFNELGITTLWINPLLENNQENYTYHGYAISDYYRIDPRYGDNDKYTELVEKAHDNGLKVIKDMVLNHCGINHWWIKDLPSQDWIHQFPEFTRSNFRSSALIDPYASEYDINLQQNGWFDINMPDLNQKNKFLATYLIQNSIWWIEFAGIDGIRLDTQPYSDKDMISDWAEAIYTEYSEFEILGESWLQKIALTAYWQKTTKNQDSYSSNIPVITDFPLYNAISAAFNEKQDWTKGMARLYYVLAQDFLYENATKTLVFLDNHDVDRIYSSLKKDILSLKLAIAFQLTTRGIPSVYYGTELLEEGFANESHGKMRMDFPGGWPSDQINCFSEQGRTSEQNDIFNYYSKLLNWRKSKAVIHKGNLMHFVPENNVYVYFRYNDNETIMVIINNNESDQKINTSKYKEMINNFNSGYEVISGTKIPNLDELEINGKSAMIIELK